MPPTRRQPRDPNRIPNTITFGISPEVRKVLEARQQMVGSFQSVQDTIRELILIGAGVECDEAILLIARQHIRRQGQTFIMHELQLWLKDLNQKLKAFVTMEKPPEEGDAT